MYSVNMPMFIFYTINYKRCQGKYFLYALKMKQIKIHNESTYIYKLSLKKCKYEQTVVS